ncbi:MAG: hypothetical protein K6A73_05140 [Bacteroidales bacterium]|nr:hypothetical protein [Bacteroidales bacterium]
MKKLLYMIAVASVLFGFTSCNKDKKIDVEYAVNIEINPYNVINNFTPVLEDDFDMMPGDVLRLRLFIYDKNGSLVDRFESQVADYTKQAHYSGKLPDGEYTCIAMSDVYTPSSGFAYWETNLEDNISTIQINETGYIGSCDKLLGLKMQNVVVKGGSVNTSINLESLTALCVVRFAYIHKYDNLGTELRWSMDEMPDRVLVDGTGFKCICPYSGYWYTLKKIITTDYSADFVKGYAALLPGNNLTSYPLIKIDSDFYTLADPMDYSFNPGQQYAVNIDVQAGTMTIDQTSKCIDNSSYQNIKSNKVLDIVSGNAKLIESSLE